MHIENILPSITSVTQTCSTCKTTETKRKIILLQNTFFLKDYFERQMLRLYSRHLKKSELLHSIKTQAVPKISAFVIKLNK